MLPVDKGLADWKWDLPPSAEEQIKTLRPGDIIASDQDSGDQAA
jgi:hypothetical protein